MFERVVVNVLIRFERRSNTEKGERKMWKECSEKYVEDEREMRELLEYACFKRQLQRRRAKGNKLKGEEYRAKTHKSGNLKQQRDQVKINASLSFEQGLTRWLRSLFDKY